VSGSICPHSPKQLSFLFDAFITNASLINFSVGPHALVEVAAITEGNFDMASDDIGPASWIIAARF
jgi:hypothetical protein